MQQGGSSRKRGRQQALAMGLKPVGFLGILIRAKQRGLIENVRPLIEQVVREIDFRLAPDLIDRALKTVQE